MIRKSALCIFFMTPVLILGCDKKEDTTDWESSLKGSIPREVKPSIEKAHSLIAEGSYDHAEWLLEDVIAKFPKLAPAYLLRARALFLAGRTEQADGMLIVALQINDKYKKAASALYREAMVSAFKKEDRQTVETMVHRILKLDKAAIEQEDVFALSRMYLNLQKEPFAAVLIEFKQRFPESELLPALCRWRCKENLKHIGLACVFHRDDKGQFPESLLDLYPDYITDPSVFFCPSTLNQLPPRDKLALKRSKLGYTYHTEGSLPSGVLAADSSRTNHFPIGRHMLFTNGAVQWKKGM